MNICIQTCIFSGIEEIDGHIRIGQGLDDASGIV